LNAEIYAVTLNRQYQKVGCSTPLQLYQHKNCFLTFKRLYGWPLVYAKLG